MHKRSWAVLSAFTEGGRFFLSSLSVYDCTLFPSQYVLLMFPCSSAFSNHASTARRSNKGHGTFGSLIATF